MGEYDKKIEGQCGTCKFALSFGPGPSPSGPEDGVHCSNEALAKDFDKYQNSPELRVLDINQKELKEYGFMDLIRLECVAEESVRCEHWEPSEAWLAQKAPVPKET